MIDDSFEYETLDNFSTQLYNMTEEQLLKLSDICCVANDFLKLNYSKIKYADNRIRTHLKLKKIELETEYYNCYKQLAPDFKNLTDYLKLQDKIFEIIEYSMR